MPHLSLPFASLLASASVLCALPSSAQIIPDASLGAESSIVTPDMDVRGDLTDLIEGGATRGTNLFHSFTDFNVTSGQRVYFANPVDIEAILSRVTGDNTSDIFGTLGIDGSANLFLINPNGIVFGPDVRLDVAGSLYATTAEAVEFGGGVFGATSPEQSQLLAVSPNVSFWNYLTENSGDVINRGQIAVGGDLVLAGSNLDLEAQVVGAGNVYLLATDAVKIRDSAAVPFIGFAGGDLLVHGSEQIDIVALSHPSSGLFSYGDMVLRSAEQVGGDAHFFSGGNFRIENLDNDLGDLYSPIDPIIRSLGDVEFESYLGSSLHILAGGSVKFKAATIITPDPGILGVDFLQETIQLSDGTIVDVDGGAQATIDIRAGVNPQMIDVLPTGNTSGLNPILDFFIDNIFSFQSVPPTITATPSSANIEVGSIQINASNSLVLLTNLYEPNTLLSGDIKVLGNDPFGLGFSRLGINLAALDSGSVFLDSRNNISIVDADITVLGTRSTGDVVLVASDDVILDGSDSFLFSGIANSIDVGGQGVGGEIKIKSRNLSVLNGAQIDGRLFGNGIGSDIFLNIKDSARFQGVNSASGLVSGVSGFVSPDVQGQGSNIEIIANDLLVLDGAQINTSTLGIGNAGNIRLEIGENARFEGKNPITNSRSGVFSRVESSGQGEGGNVYIEAESLDVVDGAALSVSTFGTGNAGILTLRVDETARFSGSSPDATFSGAFGTVSPNAMGQGGIVRIEAETLEVLNGAVISTSSSGTGNAGSLILEIGNTTRFDQASEAISRFNSNQAGQGGLVQLSTANLEVLNGSILSASSFGPGDAGNVYIVVRETARFEGRDPMTGQVSNASSDIQPNGSGNGGEVNITARNLEVLNGAQLRTAMFGMGEAGSIVLNILELAKFEGSGAASEVPTGVFSNVEPEGRGQGGDIRLNVGDLQVLRGAQIASGTRGIGDAGDVIIVVDKTAILQGSSSGIFSSVDDDGRGQGGDIQFNANNLIVNGAQIASGTRGIGNAGDVNLTVRETLRLENINPIDEESSGIFSSVTNMARGVGGDIHIASNDLTILDSKISAGSSGDGDAGNIFVNTQRRIQAQDGNISTNSTFNAGGQIQIDSDTIFLFGNSDIVTFVNSGLDNGGDITITAAALVALDDSDILAFAVDGRGGDVDLSRTAFFGQNFEFAPSSADPRSLDGNGRVDINASGGISSGIVSLSDVSFIENSLNELPDDLVNSETLVSSSCIVRSNDTASSLIFSGSGSLPQQPITDQPSYSLSTVQLVADEMTDASISEPQQLYRLADGRLVMSRECSS